MLGLDSRRQRQCLPTARRARRAPRGGFRRKWACLVLYRSGVTLNLPAASAKVQAAAAGAVGRGGRGALALQASVLGGCPTGRPCSAWRWCSSQTTAPSSASASRFGWPSPLIQRSLGGPSVEDVRADGFVEHLGREKPRHSAGPRSTSKTRRFSRRVREPALGRPIVVRHQPGIAWAAATWPPRMAIGWSRSRRPVGHLARVNRAPSSSNSDANSARPMAAAPPTRRCRLGLPSHCESLGGKPPLTVTVSPACDGR